MQREVTLPRRRLLLGVTAIIMSVGVMFTVALRKKAAATPTMDWINETIDGLHYAVLLPANYKSTKHYPVVLYLHQYDMGNYRNGLLKQVEAWFGTSAFRTRHLAIIIVPMLDQIKDPKANFGGKHTGHAWKDATIAALKHVLEQYSADPARIYVTGNSMGGMGTWDMLLSYNARIGSNDHFFAAGMPLAGRHQTANPVEAARVLRQVPIWAIHGAQDAEVSPEWDRTMAKLLSDSPTFRYTEDPGLRHDVWDSYYMRTDVWDWLFAQSSAYETSRP
ncbi:alpha/beta hydrolase-fold protein [Rhodopila sp.]|uniref:carboxylesterase family protein n=1 Tax=Rhodopila sp. TaxID=2480087 RepID=UPI003D0F5FB8